MTAGIVSEMSQSGRTSALELAIKKIGTIEEDRSLRIRVPEGIVSIGRGKSDMGMYTLELERDSGQLERYFYSHDGRFLAAHAFEPEIQTSHQGPSGESVRVSTGKYFKS